MKKYSKPFLKADAISSISEPVYLYSGPWEKSDCYSPWLIDAQIPEDGRIGFTVQVNAWHYSGESIYHGTPHHNNQQVLIFVFNTPIPAGVTGTLNGLPLEFNETRTKCRTVQTYHQNFSDYIGSGSYFMVLNGFTEEQWANETYIKQFLPVDFLCSDVGLRSCQHGYMDGDSWISTTG